MSDERLTWHVPGVLSETGVVDVNTDIEYTTDETYVPVKVILRLKTPGATSGDSCTIDINDDGESIFDVNPTIGQGLTEVVVDTFRSTLTSIAEGSVMTLDIDQVSGLTPGADLTVEMFMDVED